MRISVFSNAGVQIEPEREAGKSDAVKAALVELGLLPERAVISSKHFIAAKTIARQPSFRARFEALRGESTDTPPVVAELKKRFSLIENAPGNATLEAYQEVLAGPGMEEPSFIIRSRAGLSLAQQREFCESVLPLMKTLDLSAWGLLEYGDSVSIDGEAPRKSGLYLFNMQTRGYAGDDGGSCRFANRLRPLISRSAPLRLGQVGIVYADGAFLPDNSLVYGGGDHSLYSCKSQWGLALTVELALQKLGVPYDACRGEPNNPESYVAFNGSEFKAIAASAKAPFNIDKYLEF